MIKKILHSTSLVHNYRKFQLPFCTLANSKIFMNYIDKESDPKWLIKGELNKYVMLIKSINCPITVYGKISQASMNKIHIISLLPLKFWLVFENDAVITFENSSICKTMKEQLLNKESFVHQILTSSTLVSLLTDVRPTARIIRTIDNPEKLLFNGQIKAFNNQSIFLPYNKGVPYISIGDSFENIVDKGDRLCQIVKWEYNSVPSGILLPVLSTNYETNNLSDRNDVLFERDDKMKSVPFNRYSQESRNLDGKSPLNSDNNKSPSTPMDRSKFESFRIFTPEPKPLNLKETIRNLMKSYRLRDEEFTDKEMSCAPKSFEDFVISEEEISKRKRFTNRCVISIDPDDAKDIDDALHVETLSNGNYLVGVHIADVSHFVQPNSDLDSAALGRASSIYLKHRVIPMLPSILSESLCSLNPNEDKLAFTVMLLINSEGMVMSENFMKTVIRPKMKLSYKQANALIDGDYNQDLAINPYYEEAVESLKILNKLATIIRKRRSEGGALILQKPTITFKVESDKIENDSVPEPIGFEVKLLGKSNFLIEEFMLLANEASAKLLFNNFLSSDSQIGAFLRRHPCPDKSRKNRWFTACQRAGFTPKSMEPNNIMSFINSLPPKDSMKAIGLSFLTYIHMQLAMYCCAENNISFNDPDQEIKITNDPEFPFHHYGLNVPLYTHFTSPIRRYGDVVVHRQISAILEGKSHCGMSLSQRLEATHNCNISRMANRRMNDELTSVYMAAFLNKTGWRLTKALILLNHDSSFIILLPTIGILHKCDIHELAPWSSKQSETIFFNKSEPVKIRFKYSASEENYIIDNNMGFPRYNTIFTFGESDTMEMRVNNLITQNEQEYHEIIVRNFLKMKTDENLEIFDVQVFEELDCLIYCKSKELKLVIELPFPPLLSFLKEESSRIL